MRRYSYFFTTTAAFLAVVLTASAWLGVASGMTAGKPGLLVAILGAVFSLAFMWFLVTRLRALLAHPDRRWIEAGILVVNIGLLIVAYAWVHHQIGLMDFSGAVPRATQDFGDALYFSVVTLTTLGYGDMVPIGAGRFIAALQGMTGYFILGIIVSTGFQIIAPDSDPAGEEQEREEQEREEQEREEQEREEQERSDQPSDGDGRKDAHRETGAAGRSGSG